jgi:long-chain-fatty-acid--CoA ligase ACSBG
MPKGVMISHDNMTWTQKSLGVKIPESNRPLRIVSYLPLSHSAGQFCDIANPIINGHHVFFADPSALQGTLLQTIQ